MSDANRIRIAYKAETVYGTVPASSSLPEVRLTGESLKQDTQSENSAEIRRDRQIAEVVRTNIAVSGDINFEFSATTFVDFLQWTLQSAGWSTVITVTASTISASSVDNSINDSAAGFGSLAAGQWIKVSGFAVNQTNNGYFKIVSKTSTKIVLSHGATLITEAAGASVTIRMGAQIVNGVTLTSATMERNYADLTNIFARYTGCCFDNMSLAISAENIITGSFGIIGKKETSETASFGSGYDAQGTDPIMNGIDHVLKVIEGGTEMDATSWSFQLNNNLRGRTQISDLGQVSVGSGTCECSGTLQAYFTTAAIMNKYLGFTATSLAIIVYDGTKGYVIEFPNIRFTNGQRTGGGLNQDIIADLTWSASRHATEDVTIRIAQIT